MLDTVSGRVPSKSAGIITYDTLSCHGMCTVCLPRALTQEEVTSGNQKDNGEHARLKARLERSMDHKILSRRKVKMQVRAIVEEAAVWRGLRG